MGRKYRGVKDLTEGTIQKKEKQKEIEKSSRRVKTEKKRAHEGIVSGNRILRVKESKAK